MIGWEGWTRLCDNLTHFIWSNGWGSIPGEVATDFFMVSFGGPIPPSGATLILV